jgi:hypothetical protein
MLEVAYATNIIFTELSVPGRSAKLGHRRRTTAAVIYAARPNNEQLVRRICVLYYQGAKGHNI